MSSTTTTSTSPNASESSSEHCKDINMRGFISTQHHHDQHASFVPMFGSSPSPSMQTTVLDSMIDRLPMLEHGLHMPASEGYFKGTGPCFSQSGVDNKVSFLENGVFGSVNIGVEGDMFVPPLENISTSINHNLRVIESTCKRETNDSYFDDINIILNNCNISNNNKGAENKAAMESLFQEELTMGEWDFEELMKDAPSFPFLDFSF